MTNISLFSLFPMQTHEMAPTFLLESDLLKKRLALLITTEFTVDSRSLYTVLYTVSSAAERVSND